MSTRRGPGIYRLSTRSATSNFMFLLLGSYMLSHALMPTATAQAQRRDMSLTLREATAFALQSNLEIQIAGVNPLIREAQITERKGIFDLNSRASFRASDARTLETSNTFLEREGDLILVNGERIGRIGQDNSQE